MYSFTKVTQYRCVFFILGWPRTGTQNETKSQKSTYIVVGVICAVVGAVIITCLVTIIILRQRKVCFKPEHARFPFSPSHSSYLQPDPHLTNNDDGNSACSQSYQAKTPTKNGALSGSGDTDADWFTRSFPAETLNENTTVSRQFLTDGHERAVNFNYKITLYGYDPTHKTGRKKTNENEYGNIFMI